MKPMPHDSEPRDSGHEPGRATRNAHGLGCCSLNPREVMEHALEQVSRAIPYDSASVLLLDGDTVRVGFTRGHQNGEAITRGWFAVQDVPALQTIRDTLLPLALDDAQADPHNSFPAGQGIRSWLGCPLLARGRVTGFICLGSAAPGCYGSSQATLLAALTEQAATAIDNATLYEQACRRAAELRTITEIGRHLAAALEPGELFQRAVTLVRDTFRHYVVSVWLLEKTELRLAAQAGDSAILDEEAGHVLKPGRGIIWSAAATGKPVLVPDVDTDPRYSHWDGLPSTASELAVPIRLEGETLGVLDVESDRLNAYGQSDLELLTILADQLAVAMRTARLYQQEQTGHRVAETLSRISAILSSTLDEGKLLRLILEQLSQVIRCTSCSVLLTEGNALRTVAVGGLGESEKALGHLFSIEEARLAAEVLTRKKPSVIGDVKLQNGWTDPGFGEYIRAWIGAPLIVKDKAVGVLCVDNSTPEAYEEKDGDLVMAFANHAAAAIENARLYQDAQRRLRQLAALQDVSARVGDSLDLPTVLNAIAESALRLVNADDVHIFLYNDDLDELHFGTGMLQGGRILREPVSLPRTDGLTYTVAHTGSRIVANDIQRHPLFGPNDQDWGMQSIVGIPVKHGGRVVGVLNAACARPHTFTPDEVGVLDLLAQRAAASIENARLYDEAQRRLQQLGALQDVSAEVAESLELPQVLDGISRSVLHLVDADDVHIFLYDNEQDELRFGAGAAQGGKPLREPLLPPRPRGVTRTVAQSGDPLVVNDPQHHPLFASSTYGEGLEALAGIPLKHGGRVLGVLIVACARPHTFTRGEVGVLELFAERAATAIEHAQLVDQLRDSERRTRELNEELRQRFTELKATQARLVQSEKLAAVGQLVSGVAHELNNPLTTILGYTQLILDSGDLRGDLRGDARRIFNAASRSAEIVRSLLTFSRQREPAHEQTDVNAAIKEALSLRHYQFRAEDIVLVCDFDPSLPPIVANPHRLQEVILNLVINAEQAMTSTRGAGRLVVRTLARPGVVRIEVEDNGPGIPTEIVDRVFEPFFTTKEVGQGTGLGLSICYGIVEEHGGKIWVESRRGKDDHGCVFIVELPISGKAPARSNQHSDTVNETLQV